MPDDHRCHRRNANATSSARRRAGTTCQRGAARRQRLPAGPEVMAHKSLGRPTTKTLRGSGRRIHLDTAPGGTWEALLRAIPLCTPVHSLQLTERSFPARPRSRREPRSARVLVRILFRPRLADHRGILCGDRDYPNGAPPSFPWSSGSPDPAAIITTHREVTLSIEEKTAGTASTDPSVDSRNRSRPLHGPNVQHRAVVQQPVQHRRGDDCRRGSPHSPKPLFDVRMMLPRS